MKQRITRIIAFILTLSLCFAFASCLDSNENENGEPKPAASFVQIDINPSIELTVSEDGKVVSVYGANDDGKILLYEEDANLIGKNYEEAVKYVTDIAVELGYLTEDNADFTATVVSQSESSAETIKAKIEAKIVSAAKDKGLTVTVDNETAIALLAELERFKAEYPNNAKIQALTPAKYSLAISASNGGEITLEAAAELSDEALIAEVKKAHDTLEAYATDAYMEAKARALALFESSAGVLTDGIYTVIYTSRVPSILTNHSYVQTIHYGASYQAYKTSARTYASVLEIMKFANEYTSLELPEAAVAEIAAKLNIQDTSVLENEDGKVTLDSVISYAEELISTDTASTELKAAVTEAINLARDAAELVAIASDTYRTELNALKVAIQNTITAVSSISSTVLPFLPTTAKAEFETALADLQATYDNITKIIESGDTSDAVKALAEESEKKAAEFLKKIEADLTDTEKETANTMKNEIETQINALKEEFESALTAAETEAKEYLKNIRAERKAQN